MDGWKRRRANWQEGIMSSATATGGRGSADTSRHDARTGRYPCRILILKCCPRPEYAGQVAVAEFAFYATYDGDGFA
jgi:hypothetical protein